MLHLSSFAALRISGLDAQIVRHTRSFAVLRMTGLDIPSLFVKVHHRAPTRLFFLQRWKMVRITGSNQAGRDESRPYKITENGRDYQRRSGGRWPKPPRLPEPPGPRPGPPGPIGRRWPPPKPPELPRSP